MPLSSDYSGAIPNISTSFVMPRAGALFSNSAAVATSTPDVPGQVRFCPLHICALFRLLAIGIEVTGVAVGDASDFTGIAIYTSNPDTGMPYKLVQDFGTIQSGAGGTGFKQISVAGLLIYPGFYWGATMNIGTPSTPSNKRYVSQSSATIWNRGNLTAAVMGGYNLTGVNTYPFAPVVNQPGNASNCPRLYLRGVYPH